MTNDQHNQALPNRHIEALAKVDSVLQERDASLLNPENSTSPGVALTLLDGQFIIETLTMWPLMLCPVAHPGKYRVEILS